MGVVTILFDEKISNKDDIFELFQESELNFENSSIKNWDALEEIISDAFEYRGFNVSMVKLSKANISENDFTMLMSILLCSVKKSRSGSLKIEF